MMTRPEKIYDLRTFLTLFVSGEGHFCPLPGIWPQILCVWKIAEIAETLRKNNVEQIWKIRRSQCQQLQLGQHFLGQFQNCGN